MEKDGKAQQSVVPDVATDPLILAVDVGTSSARALVYDGLGRQVEGWEAHRPNSVRTTPDGGVELDPLFLFDQVVACIDNILSLLRTSSRSIAAVAFDTFWHSLVGVGLNREPLTPIYTWADTRSGAAAVKLKGILDEKMVHARTGAVLHSSYLPAKLLWLRGGQGQLMDEAAYWMSFGEYFYFRLFGERRVSISMASATGLFDQNSCTWDAELLQVLELDPDKLSPLAEFSDVAMGLEKTFAERWPLLARLPWYLPLGDGACNNVGSGGFCEEWAVAMIGTSGALRVVQEAARVEVPWGLWTYRVDLRRFVQGGALSDGGNVFSWLEKNMRLDPPANLEKELAGMPADGHGLTMLPFLAGERSPDWRNDVSAAFVGMTLDTTASDIARASLEAVAIRFGVIYDILKRVIPTRRGIIGSGTGLVQSPLWMQIMADVLGEPMVTTGVREASSRGAALLVLESIGALGSLADAPAALGTTYEPNEENTRIYHAAMRRQQELYARLFAGPAAPQPDEPVPAGSAAGGSEKRDVGRTDGSNRA